MERKLAIARGLFAVFAAFSLTVVAATNSLAEPKTKATEVKNQAKPHSHMQEKTGVAQRVLGSVSEKPSKARDRDKHFHPRDGK